MFYRTRVRAADPAIDMPQHLPLWPVLPFIVPLRSFAEIVAFGNLKALKLLFPHDWTGGGSPIFTIGPCYGPAVITLFSPSAHVTDRRSYNIFSLPIQK